MCVCASKSECVCVCASKSECVCVCASKRGVREQELVCVRACVQQRKRKSITIFSAMYRACIVLKPCSLTPRRTWSTITFTDQ